MYLKEIALQGFKSFAHPVTVDLAPGLNVIVGPNGSGKSNLLDALRWVLGDRKEVRSAGGKEVLFHGSSLHRPVNMASVELLLVGEGVPPFRIEKRSFASGDTEYFFQGTRMRFGDLRRQLQKLGLSLTRLEVGFVTNRDLHALADLSPLERLRWLEEASGTHEARVRLSRLSQMLRETAERVKRFQERLKELSFQKERVAEWAEREKAYLTRERQWQSAQKVYLERLLAQLGERLEALEVEENRCELELCRLSAPEGAREVEDGERRLLGIQEEIRHLHHVVEEKKRRVTEGLQELYRLLTQIRERKRTILALEEEMVKFLEESHRLEERVQASSMLLPEGIERLSRTEAVIGHFLKEKEGILQAWREERQCLREELARCEASLERMAQEKERTEVLIRELERELAQLERLLSSTERDVLQKKNEREKLVQEREEVLRALARVREGLSRIRKRRKQVGLWGTALEFSQAMREGLLAQGWPQRAVHAIFGLLSEIRVLQGGEALEVGTWAMRQDALPPWSSAWEVVKSEEILECFVHGEESPKHLVASDGSALLLRGGLLVLPRRLVHRGRFLKSWERRERLFERRARELEETLAAISGREQDLEKHLRALEFRVIRWRERYFERNVRREELQRSLDHLGEECARLLEEREEVQGKLRNLEGDIRALETTLARARRALGKVREWKRREEEKKRAWERLLWEVHGMHKRGIELLQKFRENETTLKLLLGELGKCARALQDAFRALAAEEALLAEREKMAQSLQVDVEAKRQRERMLERQKERWIRERERLRFEKQRLSEEMARTKTALEALGDVACAVPGELKAMSLQELGAFLERERQALLGERVRRGAIEEYQELEARERDLRRQDAFFQSLLGLIRKELQGLEREVERTFLSFLQNVQAAFGRYFQQVFPRGEASFAVHDGVHLEVQIPGKKKQGMALLSSGERTLVALCFLCACFEAFGAKMCFFDEIDANLDHTNSVLLARILREFSASRQVVVVTHKEEVMEVADRILGVTMSEPGVSRVLLCEGIAQAQEFSLGGE